MTRPTISTSHFSGIDLYHLKPNDLSVYHDDVLGRIIPWLKRWFEMVFFIIPNPNWTLDDANTKRLAKKCIVFIKSWNSHTKVERWILKSFIALEHGTVIKAFFALIYPSIFSSADLFSFRRKSSKCNKTVLNVQRERERAVINKLNFPQIFNIGQR